MRKSFLLVCLLLTLPTIIFSRDLPSIVPAPAKLEMTSGAFTLRSNTPVYVTEAALPVAKLWVEQIRHTTGYELPLSIISNPTGKRSGVCFALPKQKKNHSSEAYTLEVTPERVLIKATGAPGLFYGSQTLRQLLPAQLEGTEKCDYKELTIPSLSVSDQPRFGWRGYMQDVSRTFYSIDFLKKYIDVMGLYKLNTLHLHLTDDQGWRMEIKKYPRLTSSKATTFPEEFKQPTEHSGFYTQEQLRDLVKYAAERHVQIVPEIDVPGHSWPVLITYPELAVRKMLRPDYVMPFTETYHVWGNQFTPNTLDPTNENVYRFLEDVFTEVASVFPSTYIHFGGDEVVHSVWAKEPHVKAFMETHKMEKLEELQSYFVRRVSDIIRSKGRIPMGWNDILADAKNLPAGTAIMSWVGSSAVKDAAKYKFPTVATPSSCLYFDIRQGSPDDGVFADLSYGHVITLKKVYDYDPAAGLDDEEKKYLLGVQANMWPAVPQTIKDINVQNFPRLLALAEIGWVSAEAKDYNRFEHRVQEQLPRLSALKIDYYRPDGHIIAQWTPQNIAADYKILEWDVTRRVYTNGRVTAGLFYTKGNFLHINSMQLLENGKVISEDCHRGFADGTRATSARKTYLYNLNVADYKPGARYTLRAEVSGYQGTESYGNVTFNLVPYHPFTVVEPE